MREVITDAKQRAISLQLEVTCTLASATTHQDNATTTNTRHSEQTHVSKVESEKNFDYSDLKA